MKFEINSIKFVKIINQVGKARNKNNLNPLLSNIHIKIEDNSLTVRATNLEMTCEKSISVKSLTNGECLINGDVLVKISNHFTNIDTNITCEIDNDIFYISYLKVKLQLKTYPFENFPSFPNLGDKISNIDTKMLIDLIKSVYFCAASTEIKPEISSIYIYTNANSLYSVATDSFRLAEKKIILESEIGDINILISQKNISELMSILESSLEDGDNMIEIYNNENILTLQNSNMSLSVRSINGNFPDYKQLFPKKWDTKVIVNKNELKNILNLSTVFINNYSYIDLEIDSKENIIKTKTKNDKIGSLEKETKLSFLEGEEILSSYNSNYFLDGISHINGETIELLFTQNNKPMFIRDSNNESFTYLLMPLNK
ncbi:MAG: DNA polymerase III subunit beta [Candidatus Pacebacteria bacterium]|nr:DNA polymerase III subunit beta [Candidatus Paceibacterota bacterium]